MPMLTSVWLISPAEDPSSANDFANWPRYLNPWDLPACMGRAALLAAIAAFCAGCLALLPRPRSFATRHGLGRALRILTARMFHERVLNVAILSLAAIGSAAIAAVWCKNGTHWAALTSSLAGVVIGGGLVWSVRILAGTVLHREAMGFGDVTLLAMIGAFLGWQAAVIVFFLAPFAAVVIGLSRWLLHAKDEMPFGPFLCLAAAATVFAWPRLWQRFGEYFALGWMLILVFVGCLVLMALLLPLVHLLLARGRMKSEIRNPKSETNSKFK
jgi:prepilin signal peptidase PulO-like enzyme (type II secretory pathway)